MLLSVGSCFLIVIGIAATGLARSSSLMVVGGITSALGSSFLVTFRSAMTSLFPHTPIAPLYVAASIVQSVGTLVSGPDLARIFSWGLAKGGIWIGASFLLASGLHILGILLMLRVQMARIDSHPQSLRSL